MKKSPIELEEKQSLTEKVVSNPWFNGLIRLSPFLVFCSFTVAVTDWLAGELDTKEIESDLEMSTNVLELWLDLMPLILFLMAAAMAVSIILQELLE